MDAFTVSNLLSSACDISGLCGDAKKTGFQSLPDFTFPGFNIADVAKNVNGRARRNGVDIDFSGF